MVTLNTDSKTVLTSAAQALEAQAQTYQTAAAQLKSLPKNENAQEIFDDFLSKLVGQPVGVGGAGGVAPVTSTTTSSSSTTGSGSSSSSSTPVASAPTLTAAQAISIALEKIITTNPVQELASLAADVLVVGIETEYSKSCFGSFFSCFKSH